MVSKQSVDKQLKAIKFNQHGWGRTEAQELPNILLENETIYEVANGMYEGGFALLVATDVRLLLVDKKPLNYLTVEDMRFEMINELDYSHRLLGAHISISAGSKNLKFTSYNQQRLRKLIGHVQHCMAEAKKQESGHQIDQKQHLEQINQQLQAYLLAQHQQHQELQEQLIKNSVGSTETGHYESAQPAATVKPSPELNDYLFAQSLLSQYQALSGNLPKPKTNQPSQTTQALPAAAQSSGAGPSTEMADLYAEGMQEIYGNRQAPQPTPVASVSAAEPTPAAHQLPIELNALKIAYSKLPMALRNKRFGAPSFHSHSKREAPINTSVPIVES